MIDPSKETLLPFSQAARKIPPLRKGRPVNPATIWRWAKSGIRSSKTGQRVKLETLRVGGSNCTSLEALSRFFTRLTEEECDDGTAPTVIPIPKKPSADIENALAAVGI